MIFMRNIYEMTVAALKDFLRENNENPAKAGAIFDGIYKRGIRGFAGLGYCERVTALLERNFSFELPEIIEVHSSEDTAKLLLRFSDGEYAETVLMRQRFGNCVCVSTQVGCNMGCKFCKSGTLLKRRNLTAGEIVGQVLAISKQFACRVEGVSVMGIGEPFDNFDAVKDFCGIVSHDKGLAVGRRHVTVSTCGIVPKIYEYADMENPCSLAVSLHAPNNEMRSELMPINKKYPIEEVLKAAEYYSVKTHKRVALEYILLAGINDSADCARQLCELIGGRDFYVNLIPYNATDSGFTKPEPEKVSGFCAELKAGGVIATKRREFGADLSAACGQLLSGITENHRSRTDLS